ncbi:uncharacterized protein LOC143023173 [Oratosquilla oratoria]|uniref:uncharacterized protein LOC143023173 n=1 Tax=Oratosquilla oratoria TaxID=337810 RepID=UPI003F76070D
MATWKDLQLRLQTGKTIDQAERTLLEAEKRRWRAVLTRLIAIIQSLAERNLAFRGSSNMLHQQNNGNFLKEVELLAKFDPVMKQHIERVESGQFSHSSYLGNIIQNELIASITTASIDATSYFGTVQKLYNLFSASPQRWAILKDYVTVALKTWSDTRWESRINSIEAVQYQASNIREALLKVREVSDPLTKVEAQTKRSFSKLKLIKTYLRSSMGQERLSGLAIISINHEVGKDVLYEDIIDDFANKKARKQRL